MHIHYDVPAFLLLFVAIIAATTLLWSASLADSAPPRDWYDVAGPFLFVYLMLGFFCCLLITPYCSWYYDKNKRGDKKEQQLLRSKTCGIIVGVIIIALLTTFFILLPAQLEELETHPHESWTATLLVLFSAHIVLLGYISYQSSSDSPSFLSICCDHGEFGDDVPVCLGGQGKQPYIRWYHRSLVFALIFSAVGTFILIFVLNGHHHHPSAGDLAAALWAFLLALAAILVSGLLIFIVRLKKIELSEPSGERQTIMLGITTTLALLGFIFVVQLLSSHVSTHILFVPLYIGLALTICCLCCISIDGEITPGPFKTEASSDTPLTPPKMQVQANWDALQ